VDGAGWTRGPGGCAGQEAQALEIYISRCRTKSPSKFQEGLFLSQVVSCGQAAALTGIGGLSTEVMGMVSTMEGE